MANTMNVLVVAGGGSGGNGRSGIGPGGGGGAGGYQSDTSHTVSATTYTITVGGGGSASDGSNSVFDTITANGGGKGGNDAIDTSANGDNGGSGGGAAWNHNIAGSGSAGTGSQGNSGSTAANTNTSGAGGGSGGAASGGTGGVGTSNSISGSAVTYAAGGNNNTTGGSAPSAGGANTGNGGQGGSDTVNGANGGSGIVIISYVTANYGTCTATGTFSKTTSGANTIFTFTGNGTFTVVLQSLPTVTTQAASSVTATTATGNGNITNTGAGGGNPITHRGVVYDTVSHSLPGNVAPGSSGYAHFVDESGSFGSGAFTESISGLSSNTQYFVRAYATNATGYSYGNEITFEYSLPVVITQAATFFNSSTAQLNGTVTSLNGGVSCDTEGFVYDTISHALPGDVAPGSSGYASSAINSGVFGTGPFSSNIPFTSGTTYFVRAFAHMSSSGGYAYGGEISFVFTPQFSFSDLLSNLIVSGYKWLTQTLYTAQQQFVVRPFFACKILDDSIKPTSNQFSNVAPYSFGSAAPTPDNNIVAAGFGNDNKIHFWKGRSLGGGTWDIDKILDSSSLAVLQSSFATNQVAIAVSEYYRGSYHIDIAYFVNFDGSLGADLILRLQRSEDGGVTWTTTDTVLTDMPYTNYNSSSAFNLYMCLMKPRIVPTGMTTGFIYLSPTGNTMSSNYPSYNLRYSIFPNTDIITWSGNINSEDWTIHSFDSYYLNGVDYVIFCGFRNIIDASNPKSANQNPNYSLWLTALQRRGTLIGAVTTPDVWLPPIKLLPADSATSANQNQFIFPKASVQNGYVDVLVKSVAVNSISPSAQGSTSSLVTTQKTYILLRSTDGVDFSYPQISIDFNNNIIVEASSSNQLQSFVAQDNFYYICGGNQIYQFIHNNVLADLSSDIIGYSVSETAGQPSNIKLSISNQNNQWVGASPTKSGASAIARNAKLALMQGYYDANGNTQLAPRNIFYIDDIQQLATGTQNELSIVGRDLFKLLMVLTSRIIFQRNGIFTYTDVFDGSTLGNWNQISGPWSEPGGGINYISNQNPVQGTEQVVTLSSLANIPISSLLVVNFIFPGPFSSSPIHTGRVYAMYIDSQNFVSFQFQSNNGYEIDAFVNGSNVISFGNSFTFPSGGGSLGLIVRQLGYYKWQFLMTNVGSSFAGNPLSAWNSAQYLGEVDLSSYMPTNTSVQKPYSVGLGANGATEQFTFFKYIQFGQVNNIYSLVKMMSALAGINNVVDQKLFSDPMDARKFNGQFSIFNRQLIVPPSGTSMDTDVNTQISNGELVFTAKVVPTATGAGKTFGLDVYFRAGDTTPNNAYRFKVYQNVDSNGTSYCRFERLLSGTTYIFPNSGADDQFGASQPADASLGIDLTQLHTYRIVMVDGYMYAFIDDVMVAAWNDNNTDSNYLTNGYWGFQSNDSNSTVYVKNIKSSNFYKLLSTFSINSGDDIQSALTTLVQTIKGWVFSDLMGRMKLKTLSSSDPSNYTYQNQIWSQSSDSSDKEYISQVTVYGTGVMATAQNTSLMVNNAVREAVIVDYNITTQSDAQQRANQELINYNQYINQYEPTLIMNTGSELFDAVTVINTGNNTSNVNSATRVYSQTFNEGGGNTNTDYSIQIQTGHL